MMLPPDYSFTGAHKKSVPHPAKRIIKAPFGVIRGCSDGAFSPARKCERKKSALTVSHTASDPTFTVVAAAADLHRTSL